MGVIQKNEYLILAGIIMTGAIIRLTLLPTTEWSGDSARDLLVPQHILLYHEIPNIGHVASGTDPVFYYPPLYFYLLAFIQIPSMNIWYVLSFIIIFNVISIGVLYFLVKRLSDPLSAFIATIFYTYSSYILSNQSSLTAYRFDLLIFLTGTYFHLLGIQKKQPKYVYIGLFFLVCAASINYAILILIPVFLFWTIVFFRKNIEKIIYFICFTFILFQTIFYNFAKYIITNYSWTTFIGPFLPLHYVKTTGVFPAFIEQCKIFITNIFPEYIPVLMVIILSLICLNVVWRRQKLFSVLYPLSFICITIFLSALNKQPINTYYYYSVTPFLFILFGVCFTMKKPYVLPIISGVILCLLAWFAIHSSPTLFYREHIYQKTEQAADRIVFELRQIQKQENYPDMHFMKLRVFDAEWQMSAYAYFLEKQLGKLLQIDDHYHNLAWIGTEDYLVIVCFIDKHNPVSWCLHHTSELYPDAIFIKQIPTSLSNPIFLWKNK